MPRVNELPCDVCGKMTKKIFIVNGMKLCSKHNTQYQKYGKFLDNNPRTIYDKNEYHVDGNVTYIDLYDKDCNVISQAIIDTEDIDKVKDTKWKLSNSGYAMNIPNHGSNRKAKYMGRVVLGVDETVEYSNGNGLDNRKENLILPHRKNKKGNELIGVNQYKNTKWTPNIYLYRKPCYLGSYDNEEYAKYARWYAESLVYQDFSFEKEMNEIDISEDAKRELRLLVDSKISIMRKSWDGMNIYTGDFDLLEYLPENICPLSVDYDTPVTFQGNQFLPFIPDRYEYQNWKKYNNDFFYVKYYVEEVLDGLNIDDVINTLKTKSKRKDVILLSRDDPDKFNHRMMIRSWFNKYSYPCIELKRATILDFIDKNKEDN